MAIVSRLRGRNKHQKRVDRPNVITGSFDMHYEDVVRRNRFVVVAFLATGLLAVAAFIPAAVYESTADSKRVTVDAENGKITNPAQITVVKGDSETGNDGYIEFGPVLK